MLVVNEARCALEPRLDQPQHARLVHTSLEGRARLLVRKWVVVRLLIELEAERLDETEAILDQAELQALEARGRGQVAPEVNEIGGRHRLQDGNLIVQELRKSESN